MGCGVMRYLSLFSGIEAVSVAWKPLGWECVAVCEILPYQSSVIEHHFPEVINLHDVTKIDEETIKGLGKIDIVVFGSPCQDLSVSGKRGGLNTVKEDENHSSRLFFEGVRVFRLAQKHCGARFMLWENVPGALNSQQGKDFGTILETLVGVKFNSSRCVWGNEGIACGEGGLCEWAVLDSKWFGVPQRRRRVFALLDTGDWRSRKPILLEAEHMRKVTKEDGVSRQEDTSKVEGSSGVSSIYEMHMTDFRIKETDISPTMRSSWGGENTPLKIESEISEKDENDTIYDLHMMDFRIKETEVSPSVTARWGTGGNNVPLKVETFDRQGINQYGEATVASTVSARDYKSATDLVCYSIAENIIDREHHNGGNGVGFHEQTSYTLNATGVHGVVHNHKVRRLTPIECERLQGFPDNWTNVGEPSVAKRYNALGRSMAVPVMSWIGKSIEKSLQESKVGL